MPSNTVLFVLASLLITASAFAKDDIVYRETLDDPPSPMRAVNDPHARSAAMRASSGAYISVQVNIDAAEQNIVGDAANEPSITVDPANPDNIVIGWRQFDTIISNFRQAGWSYSTDGGASWTFPGVIEPGVFRSDPVLATNTNGEVYYQSLQETLMLDVFKSTDNGMSWGPRVPEFGGDKNWLALDNSTGIGDGNLYGTWQRFFGCCGNATFTRSGDGGQSFEQPVAVDLRPLFGTMAVGPDGEVYLSGVEGTFTQDLSQFVIARSDNAQDNTQSPSFAGTRVDLGGSMVISASPNPGGLLGQANVAVDRSDGASRGNVYMLASTNPPGSDPADVFIIRSTDGGQNWTAPRRVNNDAGEHWQWFAAHDVANDGRIDAIWADTRSSGQSNISELFYAWSYDGGDNWLGNIPVSPSFDSLLGHPNQNKIGDYYTIVSTGAHANVAYSATFNGEQDVYYLQVFPDCNGNGVSDVTDIAGGQASDANANHIPDSCEAGLLLAPVTPGVAGTSNTFAASGASAGANVIFFRAGQTGQTPVPGCNGVSLGLANARALGAGTADSNGQVSVDRFIPGAFAGRSIFVQALERPSCTLSDVISASF